MLEDMRLMRFLPLAALSCVLAGPVRADSFPSWYAKAQKAEARQDDDAALQAWSNALHLWKSTDSKPKKAQALAARAALYEKKSEWEAALEDLSEALKLATKDARLYHRRGVLYLDRGKASEAISDLYKATALKLDYGEAFCDRGRAYELQGDAEFAKEDFRTACRLGFKKACKKTGPAQPGAKPGAKAPPPPKAKSKGGAGTAVPTSTAPAAAIPQAAAPASTVTAPVDIPVGSAVEELPIGESPGEAPTLDPRACISRIRSCSENGDSYSACVSRVKLCEKDPRPGCCPRDCVALFKARLNSKSEAAAFREVFTPTSPCLAPKKPKLDQQLDETVP